VHLAQRISIKVGSKKVRKRTVMRKRTSFIILMACSSIALFTACGNTVSGDGSNASAQVRSQLPEDFPEDVPVYPGIAAPDVTRLGDGFEVSGATGDSLEQVHAFYTDSLKKHGWSLIAPLSETSAPGARVYHYEKNERGITVVAGIEGDRTVIETAYKTDPVY